MGLRPIERRDPGTTLRTTTPGAPRRRGVLGGLVVFAVGFAFLLPALRFQNAGPILFIALGAAFAAAYGLGYRQFVYLVPAAVMIGLGVGLLLPAMFDIGRFAVPLFYGALAASFVIVTILAPDHRWPLVPALPLAAIAVVGVVGNVDVLPGVQPFILPVVLMLVGGYLLVEPTNR
jgi:hypothetical protein